MGAGAGKTATSSTSSPYAPLLASIGQQMWNTAKPAEQAYASDVTQALKTGGVNSSLPSINAATASARESTSQSMTQLRQQLASSGLAGTSFGNQLLQQEQMQGNQQIADIGPSMADRFISGEGQVAQTGNAGIGALSSAAGLDTTSTSTPSFMEYFLQGIESGGLAAGGLNGYGYR